MVNYYKTKMENAYTEWEEETSKGRLASADSCMNDYINYKEMYEYSMVICGEVL